MYKCMICEKMFKTSTALVSHLTHPKSSCKTNVKEYYDTYLRRLDEGLCKFCGVETSFRGITLGYPYNLCKYCKTKDPETIKKQKESRDKTYKQRKIDNGYFNLPEICEICKEQGLEKRFKTKAGLARHVNNFHKVKPKDYYDKYLKSNDEGICQITGEPTTFINLTLGYHKFLGRGINSRDIEVKKKKENTLLNNYNVTNLVDANSEKRIASFKQTCTDRRELQNKRLELISILRKLSIDQTDKTQCQICGIRFDSLRSLSIHIMKLHNILIKDYYDMYWKERGEGICPIMKLPTRFISLQDGYYQYLGLGSYSKTDEFKESVSGSNNYNWNPNREEVYSPYTEKFSNKEYRFQIRTSQNNTDPLTGELLQANAHLHHIDYNKQNDSRENLIFLNPISHVKTNANRKHWTNLLTKINEIFTTSQNK